MFPPPMPPQMRDPRSFYAGIMFSEMKRRMEQSPPSQEGNTICLWLLLALFLGSTVLSIIGSNVAIGFVLTGLCFLGLFIYCKIEYDKISPVTEQELADAISKFERLYIFAKETKHLWEDLPEKLSFPWYNKYNNQWICLCGKGFDYSDVCKYCGRNKNDVLREDIILHEGRDKEVLSSKQFRELFNTHFVNLTHYKMSNLVFKLVKNQQIKNNKKNTLMSNPFK